MSTINRTSAVRVAARYLVQAASGRGTPSKEVRRMDLDQFARRWGSTNPPVLFNRNGGVSVPIYDSDPVDPQIHADAVGLVHVARSTPRFTTSARPNQSNAAGFDVDMADILATRSRNGDLIEKFSWNPVTGEILFVHRPQAHATSKGDAPFDDYVRAIVLHDRRKVLFRPFWPTWLRRTPYDTFDEEAAAVSFDAQWHAKEMVEAHGGRGWDIEMNTNNRALTEMTGRRNW
jgi:hypothetical protein